MFHVTIFFKVKLPTRHLERSREISIIVCLQTIIFLKEIKNIISIYISDTLRVKKKYNFCLCFFIFLFLLRSNKDPGHPPDVKHRGRVGLLLRSNKVPGHPPDVKHRGRVGFLLIEIQLEIK